jgi:chromosomal replication initiation ATPase DnaA
MTFDEFKTWLRRQDLRKLHPDQITHQVSRVVEPLAGKAEQFDQLEAQRNSRRRAQLDAAADAPLPAVPVDRILEAVSREFGVERSVMLSRQRTRRVAHARAVAAWLLLALTPLSDAEAAPLLGLARTGATNGAQAVEHDRESRGERWRRANRLLCQLVADAARANNAPPQPVAAYRREARRALRKESA